MTSTDFELIQPQSGNLLDENLNHTLNDLSFSRVGDIFNDNVYLGKGTVYRTWHLEIPSANLGRRELSAKISIRYHKVSSIFVLVVNGEAKLKTKANYDDNKKMVILFKLYDHDFELTINVKFPKLYYLFDLKLNDHTNDNNSILDIRQQKATYNTLRNKALQPKNVSIPSIRTTSIDKKNVVIYQVYCEINKFEKIMVEKRFSDFVKLDLILQGLFSSNHLKDTLPVLPNKIYNPFINQYDFKFISERRLRLEEYLNFLLTHEKVNVFYLSSLFPL